MNQIPENEDRVLQIHMLGGFSMEYNHTPIPLEKQYFSKAIQLFILLLLHHRTGIRKEALLECLYGRGHGTGNNNNLNNMVSRLRRQLHELGLPEGDDIRIKGGWCQYVSRSQVEVDTEEMEGLIERAGDPETSPEEKRACLLEAVRLYRGDLLPEFPGVTWVVIERMRCQKLYEAALEQLDPLLAREGDFQQLYELYSRAARQYPLERFQEKQLACLAAMKQDAKVFQACQELVQLYSDRLGVAPFEGSKEQFQKVEKKLFGYAKSLELIQKDLQEEGREPGAYYCSYPSFLDCSSLLVRNGKKAVLVMCTLEEAGKGPEETREGSEETVEGPEETGKKLEGSDEIETQAMWLGQSIRECLRREDIYTRYSPGQYLALLIGTGPEEAAKLLPRITQRYETLSKRQGPRLRYEIDPPGSRRREPRGSIGPPGGYLSGALPAGRGESRVTHR